MEIDLIGNDGQLRQFDAAHILGQLKAKLKDYYAFTVPEREECARKLDWISRLLGTK